MQTLLIRPAVLRQVRLPRLGRGARTEAIELINYDILAYALVKGGKRDKQIMIAGYKNFVGFYTGNGVLEHFSAELAGYKVSKASVQLPNDQPIPEKLIVAIIQYKKSQILGR